MLFGINMQKVRLLLFVFLFMPLAVYAIEAPLQNQAINDTLFAEVASPAQQQAVQVETKEENFMGKLSGFTQSFKSHGGYLDLGLRTGYIYGQNSYDFSQHTSELEFPFRAYLGGGNINLGYKSISMNSEFWGSMLDDPSAGWHTKDKDWNGSGQLYSDTKSYSDMNAVIWDANMRYNFFEHSFGKKKAAEDTIKSTNMKLGLLLGYRYERFGYKDFGLLQTCDNEGSYGDGQEVSEYKIKYRLPYYGLAMDMSNDKFGVSLNAKYAFKAHAEDYDNHLLRNLHFYGDYKKSPNVFMASIAMHRKFNNNWQINLGADATLVRIDGVTYEEDHDPSWDTTQNIDTKQFIYWMGVGYRF
ncbi:MAG: omptin family outer membrane protease [Candidatus Omnitrophica bacterium]|nr:omptin family outer membrane protease [Candidatus Omnitrophota bacterium]MDD5652871.1 omptin family outer membrane protease [Candidatus Omnitrophota bacterium]